MKRNRDGFTLLEIMIVLAVCTVLSALLLPAFVSVRGAARNASCSANLRQLGQAISMYTSDFDHYPRGLDPADKETPEIWDNQAEAAGVDFAQVPLLPVVLKNYAKEAGLWRCPADSGFEISDITGLPLDASPTCYKKFGMSYFYRTELTLLNLAEERVARPAETNVLSDADGSWHGAGLSNLWKGKRYNVLFADGHVKNINADAFNKTWALDLR